MKKKKIKPDEILRYGGTGTNNCITVFLDYFSGVKAEEKKGGAGRGNWGTMEDDIETKVQTSFFLSYFCLVEQHTLALKGFFPSSYDICDFYYFFI